MWFSDMWHREKLLIQDKKPPYPVVQQKTVLCVSRNVGGRNDPVSILKVDEQNLVINGFHLFLLFVRGVFYCALSVPALSVYYCYAGMQHMTILNFARKSFFYRGEAVFTAFHCSIYICTMFWCITALLLFLKQKKDLLIAVDKEPWSSVGNQSVQ